MGSNNNNDNNNNNNNDDDDNDSYDKEIMVIVTIINQNTQNKHRTSLRPRYTDLQVLVVSENVSRQTHKSPLM